MVLHIGAHRTGSTMVAQSLEATIAAHPECGVALWGPRHLRDVPGFQVATGRLDDDVDPIDKTAAIELDKLASFFAREVADLRAQGVTTLVLSEENFIGGMRNNFMTGKFYPDVVKRLASFDSLLPLSPVRVALGVRDYGSVWTSAFHYQRQSGRDEPDIEVAQHVMMNDKRGWPQVADAAREIWPDAALLMWRQEDLATQSARICAQITGLDADQIVMPDGKVNARTSGVPRPVIFSDDELKHLTHRYNRQVRRMQAAGESQWVGGGQT